MYEYDIVDGYNTVTKYVTIILKNLNLHFYAISLLFALIECTFQNQAETTVKHIV